MKVFPSESFNRVKNVIMFNHSLFPNLAKTLTQNFNKETIIDDLMVLSANRIAFLSSPKDENLKNIAESNQLKGDAINQGTQSVIIIEKKNDVILDQYFKNLFANINHLDTIIYHAFDVNIHKLKVIGNRLLPLIEVMKKRELEGEKTRIEDFLTVMDVIKSYLPDYEFKDVSPDEIEKLDKRKSPNAPTNSARLKALDAFCPDLIKKLHQFSKNDKMLIVHLITGADKRTAYYLFTADRKKIVESEIKNYAIEFEDLKDKLKNI
jgi:regulator of extracellular matrix RemA (YlzA/DUF370 family)